MTLLGFAYGCESGEKITWSGVSCECDKNRNVFNCGAPQQEVDYSN